MTADLMDHEQETESRIGVYVCHCGGNISDRVDVEKVVERARGLQGVALARDNIFMCSDPGQDLIIEDIKNGKIDRVVVASCAPSLHETTFRSALVRAGLNPYLYEHANIREQVSWVHDGEEATKKAIAMVAAAVGKSREMEPLEPIREDVTGHATVVGGGVAGLKAALDLARRGLKVTLLEKTPFLGGWVARLDKVFPTGEKAGELLSDLAAQVLNHPEIEVLTCAELVGQEGYIGNFLLKIARRPPVSEAETENLDRVRKAGAVGNELVPFVGICPFDPPDQAEEMELTTGAVVLATGFSLYTPRKGEYGYDDFPEVITLADLIWIMSTRGKDGEMLKINGRPIKAMAMIHCVGSRQIPGLHEPDEAGRLNENCSRICCTGILQAAVDIRRKHPRTVIYDIHRDIRTYSRGHEEIYLAASENEVRFLRFEEENPPSVERAESSDYALSVRVKDTLIGGEEMEMPVDLVVLATGMQPGKIDPLIDVMKLHCGADGFLLEVHPKLRPVEVFTAGIFLAGTCQAPMDITEATAAASASAAKVSAILSRGAVELEPFVAQVDPGKCQVCLTCVRTCPFSVPKIQNGASYIHPAACYSCGCCVGECPGKAITMAHYTDTQILALEKGTVTSGGKISMAGL